MSLLSRLGLLGFLLSAFAVQTWLIYTDPVGQDSPPLTSEASRGREIWHQENCGVCHQIFGYGGFLGPDLTNLARRKEWSQALFRDLDLVLRTGSARMPVFDLSEEDTRCLAVFFEELDQLGVGQLSISEAAPAHEVYRAALEELRGGTPPSAQATEGLAKMEQLGCITCHLPNGRSSLRAKDLTTMRADLAEEHLRRVLKDGVPGTGMPRFNLENGEIEAVLRALEWLGEGGALVRGAFEKAEANPDGSLWDLPWFEFF